MEMTYNGFLLTQIINITDVRRPVTGDRILNAIQVAGRNGEIFHNSYFGTKTIEVSFYMKYDYRANVESASEFREVVNSLAFYLAGNKEPAPLIFSDQPDKYYMAIVESVDLEQLLGIGQGTIVFRCFTPYLYSLKTDGFSVNNGIVTITNDGTASCYPVFETTLTTDTKYLLYTSNNGAIKIGRTETDSAEAETEAMNPKIHADDCTSTAKWYAGSSTLLSSKMKVDTGVSIISTGKGLKLSKNPDGEGRENDGNYYGAWLMTNLNIQPEYWQTKMYFKMKSQPTSNVQVSGDSPKQKGIIHMALFDANNNILTQFNMRDIYYNHEFNVPAWYSGTGKTLYWDEEVTNNSSTTKITDNVKSLSELPSNATVLSKSEFTIYRAEVKWNGTPIYKEKNENGAVYYKTGTGTKFIIASNDATWCKIYLDNTKTTTGFLLMKHINKVADHNEFLVTYTVPASKGAGKWDDFVGTVVIERRKHSSNKGCMWNMYLYKKKGNDSWNGDIELKKTLELYDSSNTYTIGGKLAKIGVYIGAYQSAEPPQVMTFDDLVVTELKSEAQIKEEKEEALAFSYIGNAGDVIKVDCGEQMVYNNGEPIMQFVDVGSEFFDVDAFSSTNVRVTSDDTNAQTNVTIQKRYL